MAIITDITIRICVISLLRVIAVRQWDLSDITYSHVNVLIYSILEPTLGVVNTCLPTIKPAILAIAGRKPNRLNTPAKNSGPSSGSHQLPNRNRVQNRDIDIPLSEFERLDDEYPLASTYVQGGRGSDPPRNHGEITVERGWAINN